MKEVKVSVGVALEGTISGGINRIRFANKIATLDGYSRMLVFLQHEDLCRPRGDACTCGLDEFRRTGLE